jgi:anthranilate/para-aminobenzoate synthase component I
MEFNVAIRTTVVKDGLAHVPVGGGIVADSDPAAEYEETLVKAAAGVGRPRRVGRRPPRAVRGDAAECDAS